jgi:hypothetical protein
MLPATMTLLIDSLSNLIHTFTHVAYLLWLLANE